MKYIDNLYRMDAINFWRSEYAKRKLRVVLGKDNPDYQEMKNRIENLKKHQDPDLGNDVIRYTLFALYNRSMFGKSDYDIDYLSPPDLFFYKGLFQLSFIFGYSADVLFSNLYSGLDIIDYYIKNNRVPYSPIAFISEHTPYAANITSFVSLELSRLSKDHKGYEYNPVGKNIDLTKELDHKAIKAHNKNSDISESETNYSDKKIEEKMIEKCFYAYIRQRPLDVKNGFSTWKEETKNDFIETYKKQYPITFKTSSSIGRAQGLYLWDSGFLEHEKKTSESIENLIEFMSNIQNSDRGGPTESFLRSKLAQTKQCIDKCDVLPFY